MSYNCLLVRLLLFAKMVGSRAMPATKIAVHSRICNVSVLLYKTCSSYLPQFSCVGLLTLLRKPCLVVETLMQRACEGGRQW